MTDYIDEISTIPGQFNGISFLSNEVFTDDDFQSYNFLIWSPILSIPIKYRSKNKVCCMSNKKNKCIIDYKSIYKPMIEKASSKTTEYTTEDYDISIFCKGYITDPDNIIGGVVLTRNIVIENGITSAARIMVYGQNETVLNINVNNVNVGTILYGAGSLFGVINIPHKIELTDGDVLTIVSTSIFDSIAEDYTITLSGKSIVEKSSV